MQTDSETISVLDAAFVCRWAGALFFDPPSATTLAAYQTSNGQTVLAALMADSALGPTGAILADLVATDADLVASADRLRTAHSRAFLIGGMRAAPPYASVWLSPRGLLWQEPARDMARLLALSGLSVEQTSGQPPDHLSIQLNLLSELIEAEASDKPMPVSAAAFAQDQIMTWLPAFADACDRVRTPFFYPNLARGLLSYLQAALPGREPSCRDLGDVPGSPAGQLPA